MFEQPPIIPATSLRRPSDPRNWPSKIFENFFSLFWPYRTYTCTFLFGPGTRNVQKCMPNIISFLVWDLILSYNDQKTRLKASNPPKNDPKICLFILFPHFYGNKTAFYDKISPGEPFSNWKCGISHSQSHKIAHKRKIQTVSLPLTLKFSLVLSKGKKQIVSYTFSDHVTLYMLRSVGSRNPKCTKIYAKPWPLWC